jgi:GTPase involved in cell partitioning and DNA repair
MKFVDFARIHIKAGHGGGMRQSPRFSQRPDGGDGVRRVCQCAPTAT